MVLYKYYAGDCGGQFDGLKVVNYMNPAANNMTFSGCPPEMTTTDYAITSWFYVYASRLLISCSRATLKPEKSLSTRIARLR